ncbi:MAG: bifunctional 2-C-methyl-D-erythritol 4-phosphate cytidylyltransferase/2-C-methyl-D-erythritol 2,4-cyclodiphosphate synthase [Rhodobacteraceae bacterium]|nr:bifunctional 2-C-methyl-D-erythritol 4-phosphate cytidylyltransferase/2-C-methyl-D-erythritol 2,4-cyclodiphosphate synthase [Paracoccaceae bacterium]
MTTAAIIVAAGRGARAGGDIAKQWQQVGRKMVVQHSIDAFMAAPGVGVVVVVLNAADIAYRESFETQGILIAIGGETRSASVVSGLKLLENNNIAKVLIHDAARACVSQEMISNVIGSLDRGPAAAPALKVTDALWTGANGVVTGAQNRGGLFRAQTPQGFDYAEICAAYACFDGKAADDVEVARAAGMDVIIVPGHEDNLKITLPGDFARAERILGSGMGTVMDIRGGHGFDVHAFGPGHSVVLCGIEIAFDQGLVGHSDADVGMHALTDAIYGALAKGDIGRHFPPSDPQWKGAQSSVFLDHAAAMARTAGYVISNVDVTLICEHPKITPHAGAMRTCLAGILAIDQDRVSVKATTSERLGFTGRGEGIAAMANATLVRT